MPTATGGGLWGQKFGHTDTLGRPGDVDAMRRLGSPYGRPASGGPGADYPLRTQPGVRSFTISGVSRDANGNALSGCTVMLFRTANDSLAAKVVSDANGAFAFIVSDTSTPYYAVFYKATSPDVAGTTVNTLVGS